MVCETGEEDRGSAEVRDGDESCPAAQEEKEIDRTGVPPPVIGADHCRLLVYTRDSPGSIERQRTIGGQGEHDQTEDGLHDANSVNPVNHIVDATEMCMEEFSVMRRKRGKREVNKGSNYYVGQVSHLRRAGVIGASLADEQIHALIGVGLTLLTWFLCGEV